MPELTAIEKLAPIAEHLTVVTVLLLIVTLMLRETLIPGATVKARISEARATSEADAKQARADADLRIQQTRTDLQSQLDRQAMDFQRQLQELSRQLDVAMRDKDGEIGRLRLEIERVQAREQDWQQITLGALTGAERQGRMLERAVVRPLEDRLRLMPGGDANAQASNG